MKPKSRCALLGIAIVAGACFGVSTNAMRVPRIELLREVRITGAGVLLSDLLPAGAGKSLRARAEEISLGAAPQPGNTRVLERSAVLENISVSKGVAEEISVPERIVISREARAITVQEVFTAIRGALDHSGISAANLHLDDILLQTQILVGLGDAGLQVLRSDFDTELKRGRFLMWASHDPKVLPFFVAVRLTGSAPLEGLHAIPELSRVASAPKPFTGSRADCQGGSSGVSRRTGHSGAAFQLVPNDCRRCSTAARKHGAANSSSRDGHRKNFQRVGGRPRASRSEILERGHGMRFKTQAMRIARLNTLAAIMCWFFMPHVSNAQPSTFKKKSKPTQLQTSTADYLTRVHGLDSEPPRTMGSLWFPAAPMTETAGDYKARHTGDLLIIRVVDNFSATANGTGSQQRSFNASSGIGGFLGTIGAGNGLQNLFSPTSAENLSGKGSSTLASTLSLNFAGRVVETLPNGVLVVEAVRDLTVGNDRQTIILHGLVRPGDVASDGSVLSSAVANLEAEIRGKGLVADSIRQPNVVVRTLLKILNF